DGQRILVSKRKRCRRGDVAVFAMPGELQADGLQWLLKRVTGLPGEPVPAELRDVITSDQIPAGYLTVRGDAARSLDSRQLGLVPQASVLGVVIYPARRKVMRRKVMPHQNDPAARLRPASWVDRTGDRPSG